MLFNSFEYLIFFPIVFTIYWYTFRSDLKVQNLFVLAASFFFYGWWDWRFLSLIILSSLLDFNLGLLIDKNDNEIKKRQFLWISVCFNLGMLGVFKYFNFFIDNFINICAAAGIGVNIPLIEILLPVGISFYTFQTLSYTIDVYNKKMAPCRDWVAFFSFVSFFPQLVAGPIERAKDLLPQFEKKRTFDYALAVDGTRQILWGFFKKVVVADNCAYFVNEIFANYDSYGSTILIIGAVFFAFQIYGDFSGYSDIAIGTAKLLGFSLKQNFAFPYFSRDIAEFWRRWHISLSTWFRDYLYIPLGGSREGKEKSIRNIFIIFLVSGFWHGANWTYIIWGGLNALYFIPQFISKTNRNNMEIVAKGRLVPNFKELVSILGTFILTTFAWIFFRSKNISEALSYVSLIFTKHSGEALNLKDNISMSLTAFFIVVMLLIEWKNRQYEHGLYSISNNVYIRWAIYLVLSIFIIKYFNTVTNFIYFQF